MLKNATPRQIAFWAAICITSFFSLLAFAIFHLLGININGFILFNILIFCLLCTYLILNFFINRLVYEKIKILYKTIQKHKGTPESLKKSDSDALFNDVENDVLRWVVDSQNQIQSLKTMEEYRRNFVGNVSHELRTPIFNIQGFLHSLLDGGLEDPILTERYIQKAAQNTERLNIIVKDLDLIAKLESGEIALHLEVFDLRELVETVFEDLEMLAKEKNIRLAYKENSERKMKVKADYEQIRRVMENLIKNSIKYGSENGATRIGFYDMAQHILVEVADDGAGIDEKHLPFLFDRFYRVDKSRSRHDGGSGLGLSIVKHIVEAHHQTIQVRSTQGVGTTFGFTMLKG
jgi:two-component system, OmpR family, phosphate regulon sensor histidine kinase PhoR